MDENNPCSHQAELLCEWDTGIRIFFFFFCCALWLGGLLVTQPGSETVPSAVEAQCLNHWIAREFPEEILIRIFQNNSQEEQFDSF